MIVAADPPGAALLDAAAVMDRLRSPGGCPWDAEQTHQSLLPYLIEECYELYQAVEDGDRAAVREELGDVLLQVLFHARVAAEGDPGFDIDDVAGGPGRQAGRPAPARLRPVRCGHRGPDQHLGTPAAPLGGAEAGGEAARIQCGWCGDRAAGGGAGRQAGQPHRPGRAADRAAAGRLRRRRAAVRPRGHGQAGRHRPGGRAAHRGARFAADVRTAERSAAAAGLDPHHLDAEAWTKHWPRDPDQPDR